MEPITNDRLLAQCDPEMATTDAHEVAAIASELLNLRRRDEELGLKFDRHRSLIEILGTRFSRAALEAFGTSLPLDGRDEYCQHVRRADGAVIVVRFVGLREQLRLMREALAARPVQDGLTGSQFGAVYLEWSSGVELLLQATVLEVTAEAFAVQELIDQVRAFRATTDPRVMDGSPEAHQRQVEIAARMFAKLEHVDYARNRLLLHGRSDGAIATDAQAGTCMMCGCTETAACAGGCGWADATRTLCTRCAESVPAREASC